MEKVADYRLIRSLGEGNHGEFFLADRPPRLPVDADLVAVKVLHGMSGDDAFRRTTRELRVFASVRSPYLVTLYDAGQEGDKFFYSMEYFPLGSLAAPARPLDRAERLRAIVHAARAAHALHESGTVHRGIKPANILLHDEGAKLSDLGFAQELMPGQTVTSVGPIGSVEYLDPGILKGDTASRGSDVWSLGMTLHKVLTGVGVYGELPDDPLVVVRKVLTAQPEVSEELSADERAVVERALSPEPVDRHATAEQFADEVEALS